jgi:O-antigen/teichoic acid export membrane protein
MRLRAALEVCKRAVLGNRGLGAILQTLSTSVLIQGLNICTGILTARLLGPQGRGELAAIVMWPPFLAYLLTFGMPISLVYRIRRSPERAGELLGVALLICVGSGCAATVIGLYGVTFWLAGYPPAVVRGAQWAMLTAPLASLGVVLSTAVQADQEFRRFNQFRALPNVVAILLLAPLALTRTLTPETAAAAYIASSVPAVWLNGGWTFRTFKVGLRRVTESARLLLGYGLRAWLIDLFRSISEQLDRILVVGLLTPRDMGFYVVALSASRVLGIVAGAASMVLFPKLVSLGPAAGVVLLIRAALGLTAFMLVAALPLMAVAPFLLRLVYGAPFAASAGVFRFLLVESIFNGATSLLSTGFVAFGRPGRGAIQQAVGFGAAVPLLLVLVPRDGIAGTGVALLTATLLRLGFALLTYRALYPAAFGAVIPAGGLRAIARAARSKLAAAGAPPTRTVAAGESHDGDG